MTEKWSTPKGKPKIKKLKIKTGRPITLSQAKKLKYSQVLYDKTYKNADGSPQRWRVNGKPKTWKRLPGSVRVPIKRGMYDYGYLDESNLKHFSLKQHR